MAGNEVVINVRADSKQAERAMDNVGGSAQRLTSKLRDLRGPMLAVSGAMTAAAGVSIKFAADLEQAQGKANEVFGESVSIIERFADTSAESFGISRRAALEYSGTLGLILQNSGLTEEASAAMSTELSKLGADLAAFSNIPVPQALDKIRSGLVGEIEPLRQVGISFNAAAVEAKAMELGIANANDELTEGQKVQARYALITEQMGDIQGQFARESGTLNGQLATLKAQSEDLAASIGKELVPAATSAVTALNGALDTVSEMPSEVKTLAIAIGGLTGGLAALGVAAPTVAAGLAAISNPIGLTIVALAGATAGVFAFKRAWDELGLQDRREAVRKMSGELHVLSENIQTGVNDVKGFSVEQDTLFQHVEEVNEAGQEQAKVQRAIQDALRSAQEDMKKAIDDANEYAKSLEGVDRASRDAMSGLEQMEQTKLLRSPGALLGFQTTEGAVRQFEQEQRQALQQGNREQREAFLRDLQSWADRLTEVAQETGDVETAISIMRSRLDRLNVPAQSKEFEILGTAIAGLRDRMSEVTEETQKAGLEMKRLQEISDRGIEGGQARAREAFAQSLTREEALANLTNLLEVRARIRQTSPGSRRLRDFSSFLAGQGAEASELLGLGAQDFADFFPGQQVDPQVVSSLRGSGDPETVARLEQIIGALERQFDRDIVVNIDGREVARSQGDRALSSEGTRLN